MSIDFDKDEIPQVPLPRMKNKIGRPNLVLIWNGYHHLGKTIYDKVFKRIINGDCSVSNCEVRTNNYKTIVYSVRISFGPNLSSSATPL